MDDSIASTLAAVLAGDVERVASLEQLTPDELTAGASDRALTLTRDAVVRVLRRYAAGELSDPGVQAWASFVRRGYLAGGAGEPVRALPIDWEPAHEEVMAEVIERLDELGDAIDGSVPKDEIAELLQRLS